jgi:arsenate reductase
MSKQMVLCLCPHGGAKSVMAASWFNRLAAERGLDAVAVAAAAEDPYAAVPPPVAGLLEREGIDVGGFEPRRVTVEDVQAAARVISIGCDNAALDVPPALVEEWNDVPQASEDLDGSAAAIRRHVAALVEELRGHR